MSTSAELDLVDVKDEPLDEEIEDTTDSLDAWHSGTVGIVKPSKESPVSDRRNSIVTQVRGRLVPLVCLRRFDEANNNNNNNNSESSNSKETLQSDSSADSDAELNGTYSDSMLTGNSQMQDQASGVASDETTLNVVDVNMAPAVDVKTLNDCLRQLPCLFCRKSYVGVGDLDRHSIVKHCHRYFDDPPHYERVTDEKFAGLHDFLPVTKDNSNDSRKGPSYTWKQLTRPMKCKFCSLWFQTGPSLNVHCITAHSYRFIPRTRQFEHVLVPPSLLKTDISSDADIVDSKTVLPRLSEIGRTGKTVHGQPVVSTASSSASVGKQVKIVGQDAGNVGKVPNGSQRKRHSLALENENPGNCSKPKKKRRHRPRRVSAPELPAKQPIVSESSEQRKKTLPESSPPHLIGSLPPPAAACGDGARQTKSQVRLLPLTDVCASPSVPATQLLPGDVKAEDLASAVVFSPTASADAIIAALSVDRAAPFTADERESLRVGVELQRAAVHAVRRAVRDIVTMAQVPYPGGPSALRFVLDFFNRL